MHEMPMEDSVLWAKSVGIWLKKITSDKRIFFSHFTISEIEMFLQLQACSGLIGSVFSLVLHNRLTEDDALDPGPELWLGDGWAFSLSICLTCAATSADMNFHPVEGVGSQSSSHLNCQVPEQRKVIMDLFNSVPTDSTQLWSFGSETFFWFCFQAIMFSCGARVGFFQGDIQLLPDDMKTLKPTLFPVVPRLLNKIYDKVLILLLLGWPQDARTACGLGLTKNSQGLSVAKECVPIPPLTPTSMSLQPHLHMQP